MTTELRLIVSISKLRLSLPLRLGFKVFRKSLIDRNFPNFFEFFSGKCGMVPIFQKKNIF